MKAYAIFIFTLAMGFSTIGCAQKTEVIQVVSTEVYKEITAAGNQRLIDVRTAEEFEAGHLEGATNIDFFDEENFFEAYNNFDRKQPIYLYCQSGNRSSKVADKLIEMGFENIFDMKGGYKQWVADQN